MATPFKVKALYEYTSAHDDDLKFKGGQVINVTEEEGDDWYVGDYTDASGTKQEGMFPRNFVEKWEPEVPQRPVRGSRPKSEVVSSPPPPPAPVQKEEEEGEEREESGGEQEEVPPPMPVSSQPQQPPRIDPLAASSRQAEDVRSPASATQPEAPAAQADARAETPQAPQSSKPPPPVAPKSNAFKDRIAAFNKAEAAPIAPLQPGRGGQKNDYIKKSFVAPPPSKNAYIPPVAKQEPIHKPYIREEDPEIKARQEQDRAAAEAAGLTGEADAPAKPTAAAEGGGGEEDAEDAPKPLTLKERMALLQREQEAQRARQAEAGQKKKPPVKRPSESQRAPLSTEAGEEEGEEGDVEEADARESVRSPGAERRSLDTGSREKAPRTSSSYRRSRPPPPPAEPMSPVSRAAEPEILSGGEEADQSAAGDLTEDDAATLGGGGMDDGDEKHPPRAISGMAPTPGGDGAVSSPRAAAPAPPPRAEPDVGDEEDATESAEDGPAGEAEEEEEEVDEEEARKQRLRERMARLAGGQGAGGPFNPFGAPPPPVAPPKKKTSTKERKATEEEESEPRSPVGQGPQMVAIPGMGAAPPVPGREKVQSPEVVSQSVSRRSTKEINTEEDEEPQYAPPPPRRSMQEERGGVPPVPKDRSAPPPPSAPSERGAPPALPSESTRPTPRPPPSESRPVPRPPPAVAAAAAPQLPPMSPAPGYQTDDEMSMHDKRSSTGASSVETPLPIRTGAAPPVPQHGQQPMSPPTKRSSYFGSEPGSATSDKRSSRVPPPVPGMAPSPVTSPRPLPPPPPPPGGAPAVPSRASTGFSSSQQQAEESEEDATERGESDYEGDYDTDIASSAKHKDALKSGGHARENSLDDSTTADDETPVSTPGPVPTLAAPVPQPRAVPPPPPGRPSVDAPRAPPPAPPPTREATAADDPDYDPYNYNGGLTRGAAPPPPVPGAIPVAAPPIPPDFEDRRDEVDDSSADDVPGASAQNVPAAPMSRKSMDRPPPPPPTAGQGERSVPPMPPASGAGAATRSARQSLDVRRETSMGRKSTDAGRPSGDQFGQIAQDIDLAPTSLWWAAPQPLPPSLANRNAVDILTESEESQKSKRGGRTTISKDIYVLYMDYSQTVITAQYDAKDPSDCTLEQRHEPPPPRLRQDQLESYWQKFGSRLAQAAQAAAGGSSSSSKKEGPPLGDGRPESLPLQLIRQHAGDDALLPIGTRAYGALVYANLANASTQQFDAIRAGDIVTLRNAKFEGHAGAMRSKYRVDFGVGHVGVVEEWDGTKRSVRLWEQGREGVGGSSGGSKGKGGGVRSEKLRLGDLRSGEVRVWRVVGREWVGWESG